MEAVRKYVKKSLDPKDSPAIESQQVEISGSGPAPADQAVFDRSPAEERAAFDERSGELTVGSQDMVHDIRGEADGLQPVIDRAIEKYLQARRQKIPEFVRTHFSLAGALKINRKALGADLIKAPANAIWIVPLTVVRALAALAAATGFKNIAALGRRLPSGFKTAVQEEIDSLIFRELLQLPRPGDREGTADALLAEILDQPEIQNLIQDQLGLIRVKSQHEGFRRSLEARLKDYSLGRTAINELSGNIIALAGGATMLGKMTPGGISFGTMLAGAIAQQSAISSFFLGPALGGVYYSIFPASASLGLAVASTGSVLAVLAIFSAFSGIIADPLQARLGVHERRLHRLIDGLEEALRGRGDSGMPVREIYLARIFDLIDLLKTAAQVVV